MVSGFKNPASFPRHALDGAGWILVASGLVHVAVWQIGRAHV